MTFTEHSSRHRPDEHPFTPFDKLPKPILQPIEFPKLLWENNVNANASILSFYTHAIVPRITRQVTLALAARKRAKGIIGDGEYEDDGNYGSAATLDVEILQAISKRVHYGNNSSSHFRAYRVNPIQANSCPSQNSEKIQLLLSRIS